MAIPFSHGVEVARGSHRSKGPIGQATLSKTHACVVGVCVRVCWGGVTLAPEAGSTLGFESRDWLAIPVRYLIEGKFLLG